MFSSIFSLFFSMSNFFHPRGIAFCQNIYPCDHSLPSHTHCTDRNKLKTEKLKFFDIWCCGAVVLRCCDAAMLVPRCRVPDFGNAQQNCDVIDTSNYERVPIRCDQLIVYPWNNIPTLLIKNIFDHLSLKSTASDLKYVKKGRYFLTSFVFRHSLFTQ